jgi:hypothetical protein
MKLYRFSPIENEDQLMEAIEHIHFDCSKLCYKAFSKYLPVAGNIGVFSHYKNEFEFLIKLGEELTDHSATNFNGKYFRLYEAIVIGEKNGIPGAIYEYLYIRQPDRFRPQVGDADFVIAEDEYKKIQKLTIANDIEIFDRPTLNACELFNPDFDVLAYLTTKTVAEVIGA